MPSALRKLLRNTSNESANKENTAAADLSPKSIHSNNASPKGADTIEAQLDRKSKECETARKLIETMKAARSKDETTISELKASMTQAESKVSELESGIAALKQQVEDRDRLVEEKSLESAHAVSELEAALSSKLSYAESARSDFESRISLLQNEVSTVQNERNLLQVSLAERESIVNQLRAELNTVGERIASTTAELDSLRSRKSIEESRLQGELKKALDAVNKSAEEKGTLQWQLDKEKELNVKNHRENVEKIAQLELQIGNRDVRITNLQSEIDSLKNAEGAARHESVRKLRLAEAKYMEAEEELVSMRSQLKTAQESERSMHEEVEQLIQQQSTAIDKVSGSNAQRDLAEKASREAQEKLKQITSKLASVEKQLKAAEDQVAELRKDLQDKAAALKTQETDATKRIEAEKQRTQNVAIITSVAVLVLSRLIFA
jgi:chromosome segregation ATPase